MRLADDAWDVPSAAAGWTLRDCVAHLAETDDNATREIGADAPPAVAGEREGVLTAGQRHARSLRPDEVLSWYREASDRLVAALRRHQGDDRLPWLGRPMSARSFVSARLMEHWSHGLDILEA
ncbi:MAG TPA: maleylpyruvate isomerase N-terminal domain-containing protein, partial [Dehalococcoidia bacterium]